MRLLRFLSEIYTFVRLCGCYKYPDSAATRGRYTPYAVRAHVSTRYAHARGTRFPKMNAVGLLGLNERPRCLVLTTLTSRDATHPPKIIPEAESTVASTTAGARVRSQVSRCERLCVSPRRYCLSYSHIDPSSSHSSFHNAQLASMTSNDVLRRASATSRSASCTST